MRKLSNKAHNAVISGATQSGKTYIMKKLLNEQLMDDNEYIIILSPTAHISGDWDEYKEYMIPSRGDVPRNERRPPGPVFQVHHDVNLFSSIVKEIMDISESIMKRDKKKAPRILLIIDDCLGHSILRLGGLLDGYSTASRHFRVSIYVLIQKCVGTPRTFRINCRYMLFFNAANFSEIQRILSEYVPVKLRAQVMDKLEEIFEQPYSFVLCDNFENRLRHRLWLNGEKNFLSLL